MKHLPVPVTLIEVCEQVSTVVPLLLVIPAVGNCRNVMLTSSWAEQLPLVTVQRNTYAVPDTPLNVVPGLLMSTKEPPEPLKTDHAPGTKCRGIGIQSHRCKSAGSRTRLVRSRIGRSECCKSSLFEIRRIR